MTALTPPTSILVDPNESSPVKYETFPLARESWKVAVHGVPKSQTLLSNSTAHGTLYEFYQAFSQHMDTFLFWTHFSLVRSLCLEFFYVFKDLCKDGISNK